MSTRTQISNKSKTDFKYFYLKYTNCQKGALFLKFWFPPGLVPAAIVQWLSFVAKFKKWLFLSWSVKIRCPGNLEKHVCIFTIEADVPFYILMWTHIESVKHSSVKSSWKGPRALAIERARDATVSWSWSQGRGWGCLQNLPPTAVSLATFSDLCNVTDLVDYVHTRSLGALRAPTSRLRSFGPALGPSGLLDFVLRALWALRPCDPRISAMIE